MFNKVELAAGAIAIVCMTLALVLIQKETAPMLSQAAGTQLAAVAEAPSGIAVIGGEKNTTEQKTKTLAENMDKKGNLKNMVVDDIKIGTGPSVKEGDVVAVHYVGTLQGGQEFDNSKKRGSPFSFTVGAGQVIKGWDEGLVGMQVGGQRVLVIPPDKAYGEKGVGPIPGNATLVFSIELIEIK